MLTIYFNNVQKKKNTLIICSIDCSRKQKSLKKSSISLNDLDKK